MAKIITSLQHPQVKHLVRLRENRKEREASQTVIIEGSNLIREIGRSQKLKLLVSVSDAPKGLLADEVIMVSEAIMKKISGVQSPPDLLAVASLPKASSLKDCKRILAFDGVSDPGNMGTLLRSALALSWDGAFILKNSCDPFNDKAMRAAKGATFRLPLKFGTWDDLKKTIAANHLQPLVADMHGTAVSKIAKNERVLLVVCNEAHGLSSEASEVCEKVSVPMTGTMESLNVAAAGAILMYALRAHE